MRDLRRFRLTLLAIVTLACLAATPASAYTFMPHAPGAPVLFFIPFEVAAPVTCTNPDPMGWSISAGADSNPFINMSSAASVEFFVEWTEIGTKTVTVSNDGCTEPPGQVMVNINGCEISETSLQIDEDGGTGMFTVVRVNGDVGDLMCDIFAVDGTATAGMVDDFDLTTFFADFPDGVSTPISVGFFVDDDVLLEGDEVGSFEVDAFIGSKPAASLSRSERTVLRSSALQRRVSSALPPLDSVPLTIGDNDGELTIAGGSVTETDSGTVTLDFDLTLTNLNTGMPEPPVGSGLISVDFSTADGLAVAPNDYTAVNQVVTFTSSSPAVQTISVTVQPDTVWEGDEDFTGSMSTHVGAVLGVPTASGVILENDPEPTLMISDASVTEGDSGTTAMSFPLSLSAPVGFDLRVDYVTSDGTAVAGTDYTGVNSGFVLIPEGVTSFSIDVDVLGDTTNELDETFLVDISALDLTPNPFVAQATGTIVEDDFPGLEVDDPTVTEGDGGTVNLVFNVTLSQATSGTVTVDAATANGSAAAGLDYTAVMQPLSFAPGSTSQTVVVPVLGEATVETDETLTLNLTNPVGAPLIDGQGLGTIVNDDTTFAFGGAASGTEGDGTINVSFSRLGSAAGALTLDLLVGGTATPGDDYDASGIPTSLSFSAGEVGKSIQIPIVDDAVSESSETIILTASLGSKPETKTQRALSGLPATQTILLSDNDSVSGTTLTLDNASYPAFEDQGVVQIGVERTGDLSIPAEVELVGIDGTATSGADYNLAPQLLSWAAGDGATKFVDVSIVLDRTAEPDEDFLVELRNASSPSAGGSVGLGSISRGTVVIREREYIEFTNSSFIGLEGGAPVTVEVVRRGNTMAAFAAEICFVGGRATAADFSFSPVNLTWPSNDPDPREVQVRIVDDDVVEGLETANFELCNASVSTSIGGQSSTVVGILDNDIPKTPEVPVTSMTSGPEDPVVVYGPDGQRLVVWQQLDGDGFGILARLFSASGVPLGLEFRVNRSESGNQIEPAASFDGKGSFVIVWRELVGDSILQPDGRVVMGRLAGSNLVSGFFNPVGEPVQETVVSSGEDDDSQSPDVASDNNGNAVVTWEDDGDVKGRIVNDRGQPISPAVILSQLPGSSNPQIAMSASGDFVVIWEQIDGALRPASGARLAGAALVGRLFNEVGQPKTDPISVNDGEQTAFLPAVTADDDGNFVVVWEEETSNELDIFARLFSKEGAPRTGRFPVNVGTAGNQARPRVDANAAGDFAVVWESSLTGTPGASSADDGSLVGRFFSPEGEAQSGDVEVAETEDGSQPLAPDISIDEDDETTVVFERRGPGGAREGVFETTFSPEIATFVCETDETGLCLNESRFRVTTRWQDFEMKNGDGQAVSLTSDTGYFWFFDQANVEVVVKVLDGCAVNGHYWVFAAGLTNTEVNLRVDDSSGGLTKSYFNQLGTNFSPILDTSAFATCDAAPKTVENGLEQVSKEVERLVSELEEIRRVAGDLGLAPETAAGATGQVQSLVCASGPTSLCLNASRFEAQVNWQTAQGTSGQGQAVGLTSDTGYFWFFDQANVELVIKVLDACDVFGRYWVFAAGLTDVGAQLSVVDSETGASRSYENTLGTPFTPVLDTDAFLCE